MAYLLDSNILSEIRKRRSGRASPHVLAWYEGVEGSELFTSVLVMGELRRGVEALRGKDPRQATILERWLVGLILGYRERTLPVTAEIAARWGRLCPDQRLPVIDGLLAATALERDWVFVTRNTVDVSRSGVRLLNPFDWPVPEIGETTGN